MSQHTHNSRRSGLFFACMFDVIALLNSKTHHLFPQRSDGKFILELATNGPGERAGWVSVPHKSFWPSAPPMMTATTTTTAAMAAAAAAAAAASAAAAGASIPVSISSGLPGQLLVNGGSAGSTASATIGLSVPAGMTNHHHPQHHPHTHPHQQHLFGNAVQHRGSNETTNSLSCKFLQHCFSTVCCRLFWLHTLIHPKNNPLEDILRQLQ